MFIKRRTQHILSTVLWRQDHSNSERGNPLQQGFFYMDRQDSAYHSLCYTRRGALAGTTKSTRTQETKANNNNNDVIKM